MSIRYTVEQGDSVLKLAYRFGLLAETIWNHPDNAELRARRKDMNVLMPDDVIVVPEIELKETPKPTDQSHVFVREGLRALYRLQVFDVEEPRASQQYKLIVDDVTYEGKTDKSGTLEQFISPDAKEGELIIGPDKARIEIRFGYLDPIDEISGLQKRLSNLGFDCGELNGESGQELGPRTADAMRAFQRRFGLPETDEPDEQTIQKLEAMHDEISEFPPETEPPVAAEESGGSEESDGWGSSTSQSEQ